MNSRRFERGDVPVGCLVGFVVALIVGLIAIKAIPVMVAVGEFDKEVKAQADRASLPAHDDKYIRKQLLLEAAELDIPINAKSIWIKRSGGRIKIRVTYDKSIDFPGYTYIWHKEHYEDRPLF
jgi:hypothetical protein